MRWLAVAAALVAAGCGHGINRGDFNIIRERTERRVSDTVARDLEAKHPLVQDAALQTYLQQVGDRVARVSHRNSLPHRFVVLDAPGEVNAVSLPDGRVYVYGGLLLVIQSEDELAGVLAHEAGHVAARHGSENLSAEVLGRIGVVVASLGVLVVTEGVVDISDVAQLAKTLAFLRYSRRQEYEADRLGQAYLVAAGYDSRGLKTFLERIAAREQGGLEALKTHPLSRKRIERVEQMIQEQGAPEGVRNWAEYQARVRTLRLP